MTEICQNQSKVINLTMYQFIQKHKETMIRGFIDEQLGCKPTNCFHKDEKCNVRLQTSKLLVLFSYLSSSSFACLSCFSITSLSSSSVT